MRTTRQGDDGAAAVEFAIVIIPLVMIMFGIIEIGTAFAQTLSLTSAARQGARFAAVQNPDQSTGSATTSCATILSTVQNGAATLGMSATDIHVIITSPTGGQDCGTTNPDGARVATDFTTPGNQPCLRTPSSGPGSVKVQTTYVGHLTIPLIFTNPSFTLGGTGVFQCEYK